MDCLLSLGSPFSFFFIDILIEIIDPTNLIYHMTTATAATKKMNLATRIPIWDTDTERIKTMKQGLNAYFAAVSTPVTTTVSKADKLQLIANVFAPNAELITSSGLLLQGKEKVMTFYASDESPVMKDPNFCPHVNLDTVCINQSATDYDTVIACEIVLTPTITVGDFFTLDEHGKICRMNIYQRVESSTTTNKKQQ
jgi:hypothetical protein